MATYSYQTEVIKVDASGNYSVVELIVDTANTGVSTNSASTEFIIDGVSLGPIAPELFEGSGPNRATITLKNGAIVQTGIMTFSDGTNDYYMLQRSGGSATPGSGHIDVNRVAEIAPGTMQDMIGKVHQYTTFTMLDQSMTMYQGDALYVSGTTVSKQMAMVADDDALIQLDSGSGSVETGLVPFSISAGTFGGVPLNLDNTYSTNEYVVTVNYTTATGSGSFRAIEASYYTRKYYIPQNGHVDLSTITGVTSVVNTTTKVTGSFYSNYGLTTDKMLYSGTSGDDVLFGDIGNDKLNGKLGDDTLYGDMGDDLIKGGKGRDTIFGGEGEDILRGEAGKDWLSGGIDNDRMYGGASGDVLFGDAGNDTLEGEKGGDTLRGGRGDDTLKGGVGNDTLKGGSGSDHLLGGKGKDNLQGQTGNDTLDGGKGIDTLTGGSGADIFVFKTDGNTDTITDYQDGIDLIDLNVPFGSLTITDVAPGEVHITHSGETLIVMDGGVGTLTAADLTASDFI